MRIIGIDYGMKRIGIAISDPLETFALPLTKVDREKDDTKNSIKIIQSVENKDDIGKIVVGLPLHLSGAESDMSKIVRAFAKKLEEVTGKEVVLFDERFTSKQADTLLREREMKRKKRSQVIDILSATLILQSYLDCNK